MTRVLNTIRHEAEKVGKWSRLCSLMSSTFAVCFLSILAASWVMKLGNPVEEISGYNYAVACFWICLLSNNWLTWSLSRINAISKSLREVLEEAAQRAMPQIRDDLEVREGRIVLPENMEEEEEPRPRITRFMRRLRIRPDEQI